jgi:hypothetical protein
MHAHSLALEVRRKLWEVPILLAASVLQYIADQKLEILPIQVSLGSASHSEWSAQSFDLAVYHQRRQ